MKETAHNFLRGLGGVASIVNVVVGLASLGLGIYDAYLRNKYRKAKLEIMRNASNPTEVIDIEDNKIGED